MISSEKKDGGGAKNRGVRKEQSAGHKNHKQTRRKGVGVE